MRRLAALAAALVIATIAGCGGSSTKDPYALAYAASKAGTPDVVQVKVGLAVQGASPVTIAPDAFKLTVDSKTHRFRAQIGLPVASLGLTSAQLLAFGVTGDTVTADLLWDGSGLYLDSPVAAKLLSLLMTQLGQTPPGTLDGWLRLGTAAEFQALVGQLGAMPSIAPSATMPTVTDGASLKAQLEPYGVTLSYVETASRNGVNADHLALAFDSAKLLAKLETNPAFTSLSSAQVEQLTKLQGEADASVDLWLDASSSRLVEIDAHVSQKAGTASSAPEKVDVTILIGVPDAATTLDAPATYTEVPLTPLIQALVKQFGTGLFTP